MKSVPFSVKNQIIEGIQIHNQSFFFKKSLCEKLGYFDENFSFAFDYEIMVRWGLDPKVETRLNNNFWGAFRVHSSAKSSTISEVGLVEHQKIKEKFQSKLKMFFSEQIEKNMIRLKKIAYFLVTDFSYLLYRKSMK
jgi:hypothetical protein